MQLEARVLSCFIPIEIKPESLDTLRWDGATHADVFTLAREVLILG